MNACGSVISLSRFLVRIFCMTLRRNSCPVFAIFLIRGPAGVIQSAKGPLVTSPLPFPKKRSLHMADATEFAIASSIVESQYGSVTSGIFSLNAFSNLKEGG